jgi:hypothetical protein
MRNEPAKYFSEKIKTHVFLITFSSLTLLGQAGSFKLFKRPFPGFLNNFNPLSLELNPICHLLALLAHNFLQVSRIRVNCTVYLSEGFEDTWAG